VKPELYLKIAGAINKLWYQYGYEVCIITTLLLACIGAGNLIWLYIYWMLGDTL